MPRTVPDTSTTTARSPLYHQSLRFAMAEFLPDKNNESIEPPLL
jgi:hypothetical protein